MWDGIWTICSAIILRIVVKIGADAGEQGLIAMARRIVKAQVRTLPASQYAKTGEAILADFEARQTTIDKLRFAIQVVPALVKLRVMHHMTIVRWALRRFFTWKGSYLLLPICKLNGRHLSWKHDCNPARYYCRICGTYAPRWMGVHNGHGGYHCDLNVKP